MKNVRRPAFLAALSVLSVTAITGSGAAPAFGAADIVEAQNSALLPAAIRDMAGQEGETPVDYTIIPELPVADAPVEDGSADQAETRSRATSLTALVADHAGTETASREHACLAGAIYFEAKSESLEGQLAVAEVIINRTQSGRFPRSICGVVMQRGQFSFVRNGAMPAIPRASRDWREAVAIAHIAQNDLWESSVSNALFFHARHVSPRWRLNRVASLGNHVFYR
jgi:N-acetylmuramoyl-L-alanine amidase